jgi:hypothetical protein
MKQGTVVERKWKNGSAGKTSYLLVNNDGVVGSVGAGSAEGGAVDSDEDPIADLSVDLDDEKMKSMPVKILSSLTLLMWPQSITWKGLV